MSLRIKEIVSSLQGEGKFTGFPTTFIRLAGCNLQCAYCDVQDISKGRKMTVESVMKYVFKMGNTHVCITGGEPLMQEEVYMLIYELLGKYYEVSIETNGAVQIEEYNYKRSFTFTMDVKTPSSGQHKKNILSNLEVLQAHDEVKFVVGNERDYNYALSVLEAHPTKASIIFSPIITPSKGFSEYGWLCDKVLNCRIPNVRVGIQTHKVLGIY